MTEAEQIIKTALRKDRRVQTGWACLGLLVSTWMAFRFYQNNTLLFIIGVAMFIGALVLTRNIWRYKELNEHPVLKQLQTKSQEIVWVYAMVTQRMPFGVHLYQTGTMFFKKTDGNEITFSVPVRSLKPLHISLEKMLPHATFGYSIDKAQWYTADPWMLYRDKEGKI